MKDTIFTFDPKADYYEFFEASMADPILDELMDDCEDYDEFVALLRDGRYPFDPEAPLNPTLHKKLVQHIGECCDVNDGWFSSHIAASAALWATGELTDGLKAELEEHIDYLMLEDVGVPVSASQYLTAALEYCGRQVTAWDKAEDKIDAFKNAFWVLPNAEVYGLQIAKAVAALVTRKPEWVGPTCAVLLDGDDAAEETWELVIDSRELREALKPQLIAKLPEIEKVWSENNEEPVDWWAFDKDVVEFVTAAGCKVQPKSESHSAYIEEMCRQSQKRGEEQRAEAKVAAAKAEAERAAEKAARSDEDIFWDCVNDCLFDEILTDAERFKALILENISDIAGNFTEDYPYAATGDEPQWLLDALLKAGVEFG